MKAKNVGIALQWFANNCIRCAQISVRHPHPKLFRFIALGPLQRCSCARNRPLPSCVSTSASASAIRSIQEGCAACTLARASGSAAAQRAAQTAALRGAKDPQARLAAPPCQRRTCLRAAGALDRSRLACSWPGLSSFFFVASAAWISPASRRALMPTAYASDRSSTGSPTASASRQQPAKPNHPVENAVRLREHVNISLLEALDVSCCERHERLGHLLREPQQPRSCKKLMARLRPPRTSCLV
jgi:hypothetical protein